MEVLKTRIRRTVLLCVVGGMAFILNIVFASRVFSVCKNILNLKTCWEFIVTSSSYDSNAGIINGKPTGRCLKFMRVVFSLSRLCKSL